MDKGKRGGCPGPSQILAYNHRHTDSPKTECLQRQIASEGTEYLAALCITHTVLKFCMKYTEYISTSALCVRNSELRQL